MGPPRRQRRPGVGVTTTGTRRTRHPSRQNGMLGVSGGMGRRSPWGSRAAHVAGNAAIRPGRCVPSGRGSLSVCPLPSQRKAGTPFGTPAAPMSWHGGGRKASGKGWGRGCAPPPAPGTDIPPPGFQGPAGPWRRVPCAMHGIAHGTRGWGIEEGRTLPGPTSATYPGCTPSPRATPAQRSEYSRRKVTKAAPVTGGWGA